MKNQKYGTLYLIPVTLGESVETLPDYTLRTASLLRVFIVEDIRSARRFLRAAGYTGDYSEIIFHVLNEHTAPEEIPGMLEQILNGTDTGLMSQAGAPCVADPGALIVSAAHSLNISVKPMVGPSSILLALMASGFNGQNFMFHGYLPVKKMLVFKKSEKLRLNHTAGIRLRYSLKHPTGICSYLTTCYKPVRIIPGFVLLLILLRRLKILRLRLLLTGKKAFLK